MRAIASHAPAALHDRQSSAGAHRIELRRRADGTFAALLPAELRGTWCRVQLRPADIGGVCMVRIAGPPEEPWLAEAVVSGPARSRLAGWFSLTRGAVLFIPSAALSLRIELFGGAAPTERLAVSVAMLSYAAAALPGLLRHPARACRTLLRTALRGRRRLVARLRPELAVLATAQDEGGSYALWTALFDAPAREWRETFPFRRRPDIAVFAFHAGGAPDALRATLAAIDRSRPLVVVGSGATVTQALATTGAEYIAVVQAGEILPPHALSLLADQAVAFGRPDILYADDDALSADGRRHSPEFKPGPSRTLMMSGTLARGVWLVRRGLLAGLSPGAEAWAETMRLDCWLRLQETGRATSSHRVPHVLTHRRPDAEAAPSHALADIVRQHLTRTGFPARVSAGRPLRLCVAAPRHQQTKVSIIVPSACRAAHVIACLDSVLARTDYADFEIVVMVAGRLPLDDVQQGLLVRVRRDSRVRTLVHEMDSFNYAAANNAAVRQTDGAFVCLLNDDVAPLSSGWLAAMVGHLADPGIGVVGARLLYPDRSVQHAGIILRPDGTAEHAHRLLPYRAPGYVSRAVLSQEVSAVTGACLLTRRTLYDRLGGLDESFASAFNDVDFCLRARATGFGVEFAAEAELIHHESLSYGRHYARGDEVRAAADRARMLMRWRAWCEEDPFHNPNLSRHAGGLWHPAFPPRVGSISAPAVASAA